jgi:basic amino acid/polyamine antiporter, APA family
MTAVLPEVTEKTSATAEPSLHRVMGPWLLLLFIVGDILGTGIYALTGRSPSRSAASSGCRSWWPSSWR